MYLKKTFVELIEKFPNFSKYLRLMREELDVRKPLIDTPWGFSLSGNLAMSCGEFEPVETNIVRSLLDEVDVFVNVGANIGYYCCHALNMNKSVIAVEPGHSNLRYLLKNIKYNGWSNSARIYPVALGAGADILTFWGSGTGASLIKGWAANAASHERLVPVTTLDCIVAEEIQHKSSLILVDIEGAEKMMLEGASRCLSSVIKPIWMVEISSTEHQPQGINFNPNFLDTFEIFLEYGYSIYSVDDLINPISIETLQETATKEVKFKSNNFVFR